MKKRAKPVCVNCYIQRNEKAHPEIYRAKPAKRPESGAMRFGDDWTGVFIRGDNATYYAHHIRTLFSLLDAPQENVDNKVFAKAMFKGLLSDFESCIHVKGNPPAQVMKEFGECVDEKEEGKPEA